MSDQPVQFTSRIYLTLMVEIKVRLNEIDRIIQSIGDDESRDPRTVIDLETCYLQIRLICESIALASLAANHSELINADLQKQYNAERIFTDLAKINPDCFPRAMLGERTGEKDLHFSDVDPAPLTYKDLKAIYIECSRVLHRGALKVLVSDTRKFYKIDDIKQWLESFVNLLACHVIIVPHLQKALVIHLWGNESGDVTLSEAYSKGEFVIQ